MILEYRYHLHGHFRVSCLFTLQVYLFEELIKEFEELIKANSLKR